MREASNCALARRVSGQRLACGHFRTPCLTIPGCDYRASRKPALPGIAGAGLRIVRNSHEEFKCPGRRCHAVVREFQSEVAFGGVKRMEHVLSTIGALGRSELTMTAPSESAGHWRVAQPSNAWIAPRRTAPARGTKDLRTLPLRRRLARDFDWSARTSTYRRLGRNRYGTGCPSPQCGCTREFRP